MDRDLKNQNAEQQKSGMNRYKSQDTQIFTVKINQANTVLWTIPLTQLKFPKL